MNATSIKKIGFEQNTQKAVQEAKPLMIDPEVEKEAMAFLRQESTTLQHSIAST